MGSGWSSTRRSTARSSPPPYPAPSRTTSRAADCRPRRSPPAASAGASAASRRRPRPRLVPARVPGFAHGATTSGPARMLPWMATPGPVSPPAQSKHSLAGVASRRCRRRRRARPAGASRPSSSSRSRSRATSAVAPSSSWREGQPLVGDVGLGLGRDGADAGDGGGHGGADGQELRGDGDAPGLAVLRARHDREGHGGQATRAGSQGICAAVPADGRRTQCGSTRSPLDRSNKMSLPWSACEWEC